MVDLVSNSGVFLAITGALKSFFTVSTQWVPGDGNSISLWNQNWGPGVLKHLLPNLYSFIQDDNTNLRQAVLTRGGAMQLRPNLSEEAIQELCLLGCQLSQLNLQTGTKDDLRWRWNETGQFTVKSAYTMLKGGPMINKRVSTIWKIKAPPRMIIFGWLALQNKILTHANLQKRGWTLASMCLLCRQNHETAKHLFQECPYTVKLYKELSLKRPSNRWPRLQANYTNTGTMRKTEKSAIVIMQFTIWRERCNRCFSESSKTTEELLEEILWTLKFYEKPVQPAQLAQQEQQGQNGEN